MTLSPSWTAAASSSRDRSPSCWRGRRSRFRSNAPNPAGPVPCSRAPPSVPASRPCHRRWGWRSRCPQAPGRDVIAEINRVLVAGGISIYRLQPVQTSLESWFLQVTSRAGGSGMTTLPARGAPAPDQALQTAPAGHSRDRRGSPVPTAGMIATRVMELRKRRGLMIALIAVNIGFPAVFLLIRLLAHAFAPYANPPAGGDQIFVVLAAGFLPTFGFIVATTVGCTAGSRDLTEGMFRHLVVTGRSRLALYLARIPAGLAIVVPLVAIGYTIVCAVCVFAAPAFIDDSNVNIPPGLSRAGFENWAGDHAEPVICSLPYNGHIPGNVACPGPPGWSKSAVTPAQPAPAAVEALAVKIASQDYPGYTAILRYPPILPHDRGRAVDRA